MDPSTTGARKYFLVATIDWLRRNSICKVAVELVFLGNAVNNTCHRYIAIVRVLVKFSGRLGHDLHMDKYTVCFK